MLRRLSKISSLLGPTGIVKFTSAPGCSVVSKWSSFLLGGDSLHICTINFSKIIISSWALKLITTYFTRITAKYYRVRAVEKIPKVKPVQFLMIFAFGLSINRTGRISVFVGSIVRTISYSCHITWFLHWTTMCSSVSPNTAIDYTRWEREGAADTSSCSLHSHILIEFDRKHKAFSLSNRLTLVALTLTFFLFSSATFSYYIFWTIHF